MEGRRKGGNGCQQTSGTKGRRIECMSHFPTDVWPYVVWYGTCFGQLFIIDVWIIKRLIIGRPLPTPATRIPCLRDSRRTGSVKSNLARICHEKDDNVPRSKTEEREQEPTNEDGKIEIGLRMCNLWNNI